MGLGSGGLKGPFVDGEGADEWTWLEGKQGPWFLSVCPHLSPPSSLWDRGGRVGDALTMGSCWAWGRPPGFLPVCRSFSLAEISMGSPEENVEPLGLGSSLLRQKHWLPLQPGLPEPWIHVRPQTGLPEGKGDTFPVVTKGKCEAWGCCCPQGASG